MDPQKFGDSYDFVKRDLIHWLASAEEWATHPMYSVRNVVSLPSTPSSWVLLSLRETQPTGIWSQPSAVIAPTTFSSIQTPDYVQGMRAPWIACGTM